MNWGWKLNDLICVLYDIHCLKLIYPDITQKCACKYVKKISKIPLLYFYLSFSQSKEHNNPLALVAAYRSTMNNTFGEKERERSYVVRACWCCVVPALSELEFKQTPDSFMLMLVILFSEMNIVSDLTQPLGHQI